MKVKVINLAIWKWDGTVVVCEDRRDYERFALAEGVTLDQYDHSNGHAYVEDAKPWLLWIPKIEMVPELVHEAVHIACGVLDARGMTHRRESEEAYCYTIEHIVRNTLNPDGWSSVRFEEKPVVVPDTPEPVS